MSLTAERGRTGTEAFKGHFQSAIGVRKPSTITSLDLLRAFGLFG